jgi:ubiquinone/menaquinone biosynthesis C-methylase UbiE
MSSVDDLYQRQKRYYHLRAPEYDTGAWEAKTPEHAAEVEALIEVISGLAPARTLDVACGTGFLTQHLRGERTLLDASDEMLAIAASRVPDASLVHEEAIPLPFSDGSFERIFCSAFCDHLRPAERKTFLREARRVAKELVLVEQTRGPQHWEGAEQRVLQDGSRHEIYVTYFSPASLLAELGGGELLLTGRHLLVSQKSWRG